MVANQIKTFDEIYYEYHETCRHTLLAATQFEENTRNLVVIVEFNTARGVRTINSVDIQFLSDQIHINENGIFVSILSKATYVHCATLLSVLCLL